MERTAKWVHHYFPKLLFFLRQQRDAAEGVLYSSSYSNKRWMRWEGRVSCSIVGFLQQENWLVSLPLHLSSAYLQGSTAYTDYRNTANILKKIEWPSCHGLEGKYLCKWKKGKERSMVCVPMSVLIPGPHSPPSGLAHSTLLQVLLGFFWKAPWDNNQTTEPDTNLGNLMLMKQWQQFCYFTWIHIAVNSLSPLDPGNWQAPLSARVIISWSSRSYYPQAISQKKVANLFQSRS